MVKITDDELREINELRSTLSNIVGEVGNSTLQIKMLQEDIKQLELAIAQQTLLFQEQLDAETKLVKRLSEKYGVGSINFETGEFTQET
jgi:pyridoxal biosynthesis lyase PdxS